MGSNWINFDYVEAFKKGDRVGLPFEGRLLFPPIDEKRLQLALKSNQGSDESSIVDCFLGFVADYSYTNREQFVWDWMVYHQKKHGTGYGRTMREHFALVDYLNKHPEQYPDLGSRLAKLKEIADDANSFGNGSLAFVYPAYCYAKKIGVPTLEFILYLIGFTHTHADATEAVTRLHSFIGEPSRVAAYYREAGIDNDEAFWPKVSATNVTAGNTLAIAVKCAMQETEMAVIREAVRIGGDTDSTLATAMLVWKIRGVA